MSHSPVPMGRFERCTGGGTSGAWLQAMLSGVLAIWMVGMAAGEGPRWWVALSGNVIPVGIGNMIGGALLVALPFSYAFRAAHRGTAGTVGQQII